MFIHFFQLSMTKQEIIIVKTLKQILIISIQNKGFINRQTSDSFRYTLKVQIPRGRRAVIVW